MPEDNLPSFGSWEDLSLEPDPPLSPTGPLTLSFEFQNRERPDKEQKTIYLFRQKAVEKWPNARVAFFPAAEEMILSIPIKDLKEEPIHHTFIKIGALFMECFAEIPDYEISSDWNYQ